MFKCIASTPGSASQQSRRDFIRHLGSAVALGAALSPIHASLAAESSRSAAQKTLVGSNIYGWGQYAQRDKKKLDLEEVISALRDTGYDYLETTMDVALKPAAETCPPPFHFFEISPQLMRGLVA